jgi:hypothetical protein
MMLMGGALKKFFGNGSDGAFDSGAATYQTANLLPWNVANGGEANSTSGFTVSPAGATLSVNTTVKRSGNTCINFVRNGAGTLDVQAESVPVSVTVGTSYTFSVQARCNLARSAHADLIWKNGAGATISTSAGASSALTANSYGQRTVTATAPAGAVSVVCALVIVGVGATDQCYWDEAALRTDGLTTWVDGSGYVVLPVGSQDGPPVVKQYTTFNLRDGHVLTTDNRCRGLVIYTTGDATISGVVDMTAKAPIADLATYPAMIFPTAKLDALYHPGLAGIAGSVFNQIGPLLGGRGGKGGNGGAVVSTGAQYYRGGVGGIGGAPSWFGGGRGGGGGGGSPNTASFGGAGGDGGNPGEANGTGGASVVTSGGQVLAGFGGGIGAGGSGANNNGSSARTYLSGAGGNGPGGGGGGCISSFQEANNGAGTGLAGNAYGGGLIALVVAGNFTLSSAGGMRADGGNGGNGGDGYNGSSGTGAGAGAGGGGGGGGIILVLYRGALVNSGTMSVAGGQGGGVGTGQAANPYAAVAPESGGNGQPGMTKVVQIA